MYIVKRIERAYLEGIFGLIVVVYASDCVGWREVEGGGVRRRCAEVTNGDSVSNGKLVEEEG